MMVQWVYSIRRQVRVKIRHYILGFLVYGLAYSVPLFAQNAEYQVVTCQLSAGRPVFCGMPFTGETVLSLSQTNGDYYKCSVAGGNVTFCGTPYTGKAIIQQLHGMYASCLIEWGQVKMCGVPYTGRAVIRRGHSLFSEPQLQ